MYDNNYDTDAIIEDIKIARLKGDDESNIHQYCQLKNQIKCYNNIKAYVTNHGPALVTKPRSGSGEEEKGRDSCDPYAMEMINDMINAQNQQKQATTVINKSSIKRGNKEYVFGQRYYYWQAYKTDPWFIPNKYKNLKEEMLNNGISSKIYRIAWIKASKLLKSSDPLKKMISNLATNAGTKPITYDDNMRPDLALNIDNILSIIFYVDYDEMAFKLKSTFMRLNNNESDISLKMRHSEFHNWSKIMTETISCYGVPLRFTKIDNLYHNTEFMHYSVFTSVFNAPTSMTRYLEVAAMYCEEDGVILEMAQYPKIRPKYFDTSLVSSYGYEHELLFVASDKSMDIQSIRIIQENEDHKLFIKAMRLFNKVTNATILSVMERCERTESDFIIIHRLINNYNNFPSYMNESFREFCASKRRIRMDTYCLKDNRYYNKYEPLFIHKYHKNLLKFDYITKLFPNVETIESWDTGNITSLYLTALKNMLIIINKSNKDNKLKKIIIHCDPMDEKLLNINMFKQQFKSQNWIIKKSDNWELCLFKRQQHHHSHGHSHSHNHKQHQQITHNHK